MLYLDTSEQPHVSLDTVWKIKGKANYLATRDLVVDTFRPGSFHFGEGNSRRWFGGSRVFRSVGVEKGYE